MRAASAEFRRTMSQRRNFVNYADMTLSNGTVLHLKPEDFRLSGNTITDDLVDGDAFTVGTALGKTVTLCIDNSSEFFSQFDFYGAYFVLYVALPLPTEENPDRVEKLQIGWFTVITPVSTGTVISIEAVDNMYKFDRPYSESTLAYPATLQAIVAEACTHCGVVDNTGQFDRYLMEVSKKPEGDITYRQVISYVAQIACVNAKINANGSLVFGWYTDTVPEEYADGGNFRPIYNPDGKYATGDDLDGGTFAYNDGDVFDGGLFTDPVAYHDLGSAKSVRTGTDIISITGVRVKLNDVDVHCPQTEGWDDYCITIEENPLTTGLEQTIADALYAKLMDLTFRTFSLSYLQDPTIESGDWVIVQDAKLNAYMTIVTNVRFTTGSYMELSCNAQSPAKQGSSYSSSSARAVVKAQRQTAEQISTYDQAVQRMNLLAANAMGLYWIEVPQADGSSIYYESDKPLSIDLNGDVVFTNHSHVWKRTGSGFFQTADSGTNEGNTTWSGGIDADNNAVMQTVSAIGINADWINAGQVNADRMSTNVISAINAPKGSSVYLTFDSRCATESTVDYIRFWYVENNTTYYSQKYSGETLAGNTFRIPRTTFYVEWHSDSSFTNWGIKVTAGGLGTSGTLVTFSSGGSLPSTTVTSIGSNVTWIETDHPYLNSENKLWLVSFDSSLTISADKININGEVTLTNFVNGMATGSTVISGDCIRTGTLEGITLIAGTSSGSKLVIEDGAIKSYYNNGYLGQLIMTRKSGNNVVSFDFSNSSNYYLEFKGREVISFLLGDDDILNIFDDYVSIDTELILYSDLDSGGYVKASDGFVSGGSYGTSWSGYLGDRYVNISGGIITSVS